MKDLRSARRLARMMVEIGARASRPTAALVTDMSQPLGRAVGNSLEVAEAIEVLRGEGPAEVRELSLALGARMLVLARVAGGEREARQRLEQALASGAALGKFRQMVAAQGGDARVVDDPARLPRAESEAAARAPAAGVVRAIETQAIGEIAHQLMREGGPGAGVTLMKKRGDRVTAGEAVAMVHGDAGARRAAAEVAGAFDIGQGAPRRRPLVLEVITAGRAAGR
jgi:thymidine phosphorylase